jgi:type I restriction enzyme R subunit
MPTPEALARETIDQKLTAAGWIVQDFKALNLGAGAGVAVLKSAPRPTKRD